MKPDKDPNAMTDDQVNNLSERLSQLGVPITGKINSTNGYIGKRMCCDACVYGQGEHANWCNSIDPMPGIPGSISILSLPMPRLANRMRYPHK